MSEIKIFGVKSRGFREREGSYGIALKDGLVLVEKAKLGYFLPGGGREEDETIEECLVREFEEESGYDLTAWQELGVAVEYWEDLKKTGHYFIVELGAKGEPTYPDGHVFPVEWVRIEEAREQLYLEAHKWALEKALV